MRRVSSDQAFIDAVETVYDAAAAPDQWPSTLEAIAACFGDVGAVLIYQRDDGSFGTITAPALAAAQREYDQGEWWRHDIRFARSVERGYLARTDAITERHLATPQEVETHPFYVTFLRSHGLKWFAGAGISPDPHVRVALSIQRASEKPPFSDDELALLTRLARHVENALRLGIRLINAEAAQLAFSDALARLGTGVFLVDDAGRVVFANPAAERLAGEGLLVIQGRLTARSALQREALNAALATAVGRGPEAFAQAPKPVLLHSLDAGRFLALYVLPMRSPSGGAVERLLSDASAIVVATASRADEPIDPALARDLLGLTLSEARLAALVGSGLGPRDASEKLGITEETARTTLKRVFAKAGVSRQNELAALLTRLVLR